MNILFSSPIFDEKCGELLSEIEMKVPAVDIEICRTTAKLSVRLHQPRFSIAVCVLWIPTEHTLNEILSLGELFDDLPLIVILPNRKASTVSRGFSLAPRFLCDVGENLSTITAVLEKKLSRISTFDIGDRRVGTGSDGVLRK